MTKKHAPYGKRSRQAPGLSERARAALLKRWRRQSRRCAYCPAPCQSVDHVIPLKRGGTNYEGNLVPCCLSCNGAKREALIMEWRLGRQPGRTVSPRPPREPKRTVHELVMALDVACGICGQVFTPKTKRSVTCSSWCLHEMHARKKRDAYRAAHGLPVDPARPTRPAPTCSTCSPRHLVSRSVNSSSRHERGVTPAIRRRLRSNPW